MLRLMRVVSVAAAAAMVAVLSGCMQAKSVLTINKDGSATLVQTAYLNRKMGGPGQPKRTKEEIKQEAEAEAKTMGAGVTVKSAEELTDKAGWDGSKIVFAIEDVTKAGMQMQPGMGGQVEKLQFEFTKGAKPKVTVKMPVTKPDNGKDNLNPDGDGKEMKEMFADFLVEFEVKVEGKITATTAAYPNAGKDGVLLMRQDLGGFVKDGGSVKKIMATKSVKEAANDPELKKYIQIEPSEKITIEFE